MNYSDRVRDHFTAPRNLGEIAHPDGIGDVHNPVCGDRAVLTIRVREGRIAKACFRAQGCPTAIAASSITTELLIGCTLEQAALLTNEDVAEALGVLPANKLHCSVLAEDVIQAALGDYHSRVPAAATAAAR